MKRMFRCARSTFLIGAIVLAALAATGCHSTNGGYGGGGLAAPPTARADVLSAAAQRLGVPVRTDRMLQFAQGGVSVLTAPAANLETIPATELPRGVNFAVAYIETPTRSIPAGYYTLRAIAPDVRVGEIDGRVQFINTAGQVATEVPTRIQVESLTLPANDLRQITQVSIRPTRFPGTCNSNYETCYCCPNGWIVCVPRVIFAADVAAIN